MFTSHQGPVKPDWQVQAKALSMSVQEPRIENLAINISSSRSFPGLVHVNIALRFSSFQS